MEIVLQLFIVLSGAAVLAYQLLRQQKDNLELQKENFRDQRRLQIFDSVVEAVRNASRSLVDLSLLPGHIVAELKRQQKILQPGQVPGATLRHHHRELTEASRPDSTSTVELLSVLEKHEIVSPAFYLFRLAIAAQDEKLREAWMKFFFEVTPFMKLLPPEELTKLGVSPRALAAPTPEQIESLELLAKQVSEQASIKESYLGDLSRVLQNELLGSLFRWRVPARSPLDKKYKVILPTAASAEEIEVDLDLVSHLNREALPSAILRKAEATARPRRDWNRLWLLAAAFLLIAMFLLSWGRPQSGILSVLRDWAALLSLVLISFMLMFRHVSPTQE